MKRKMIAGTFVFLLALVTFLSWYGMDGGRFFSLMVAWIYGLYRVVDGLAHEPIAVAIGLTALVLLPFVLYQFVRNAMKINDSQETKWTLKKSFAIVLGFCSLAMTAIAMIAIAHAIHWSVYSKEPLFYNHSAGKEYDQVTMKQVLVGMHLYRDMHHAFPSGGTVLKDGRPGHGWMVSILPYLNFDDNLRRDLDLEKPWYESPNDLIYKNYIPHEYLNDAHSQMLKYDPSGQAVKNADGYITTDIAGNEKALPLGRSLKIEDFYDGTSNTIMIGEAGKNQQPWGSPFNSRDPAIGLNSSPWGFNGTHPGVVIFGMADGSTFPVSETVDPRILKALSTPGGGEY